MLFNSWFKPSDYKVLSFKTQKFSLLLKSVLVSSVVVCFLICSIKVNSACCWKLWFFKYLHAKTKTCDLASFLWLLRRMLKGVSLVPTYWSWYIRHWSKKIKLPLLHVRLRNIGKVFFVLLLRNVFACFTCLQQSLFSLERHGEQCPACFGCLVLLRTTLLLKMRLPPISWCKMVFLL